MIPGTHIGPSEDQLRWLKLCNSRHTCPEDKADSFEWKQGRCGFCVLMPLKHSAHTSIEPLAGHATSIQA